jgi:hypothetical protein
MNYGREKRNAVMNRLREKDSVAFDLQEADLLSQDDPLITDGLKIDDYRKFMEAIKSKIGNASKPDEKITFLTAAPYSWNRAKTAKFFNDSINREGRHWGLRDKKIGILGKNRNIWEKIGLFEKNPIIWEKIELFGKKSDNLGKTWIIWEKIRLFDYAIIFFSSVFPLLKMEYLRYQNQNQAKLCMQV